MPAPSKITKNTTPSGDNTRGVIWPVFTVPRLTAEETKALIETMEMRLLAMGLGRALPVSVGSTRIGFGDGKEGFSNEATTLIQDALCTVLEKMKPGSTKDNSPVFDSEIPITREGWALTPLYCEILGEPSAGISMVMTDDLTGIEVVQMTFTKAQRLNAAAYFRFLAAHIEHSLRD
jgi:hypothetical protein